MAKANPQASQQSLREFVLDMETGRVSQRVVANVYGDFPSIPRHLAGELPELVLSSAYAIKAAT